MLLNCMVDLNYTQGKWQRQYRETQDVSTLKWTSQMEVIFSALGFTISECLKRRTLTKKAHNYPIQIRD
jgi:hypothetical protein